MSATGIFRQLSANLCETTTLAECFQCITKLAKTALYAHEGEVIIIRYVGFRAIRASWDQIRSSGVRFHNCCGTSLLFSAFLLVRGAAHAFWEIGTDRKVLPRGNFLLPVRKLVPKAGQCNATENQM
jgi:hypothetical protein